MLNKPLPACPEIESQVLGAFIFDCDYDLTDWLRAISADDFTSEGYRKLYNAIKELVNSGDTPDLLTIKSKHRALIPVAMKCADSIATTVPMDTWLKSLREMTVKRNAIKATSEFAEQAYDSPVIYDDIERLSERLKGFSTMSGVNCAVSALDVGEGSVKDGWLTGYVTHDYNDSGLRPGCVTLVSGTKGHGKTAFVRQMTFSLSTQAVKSYYFIGESTMADEKTNGVRLLATENELTRVTNKAGRGIYMPNAEVVSRYDKLISPYVLMSDVDMFKRGEIFKTMIGEMANMAKSGVKVFILDNLMILTEKSGNAKFDQQRYIAQTLKNFAKQYDVHVVLVVHPNATGERISGVEEVSNLVDTILWYRRLDFNKKLKESVKPDGDIYDSETWDKITAIVEVEKIRDGGTRKPMFLAFDYKRGALYDMSPLPEAMNGAFCWSRHISKYANIPDYDKQYSG